MKTYYNVNFCYTIVVEAHDEDEAEELGVEEYMDNPPSLGEFGVQVEARKE